MAYETPITIKKAIVNIKKRHYVLPSIQREFVWDTDQIETLFDSLMRDYPISTFLFWKVDKDKIKDFQFYEFLNNYHQRDNRHNRKAELTDDEGIIALLDGQQRLTSVYVALTGSYAEKRRYFRKDSAKAYPKKKLYLNVLRPSKELEVEYEFKFLTKEETKPDKEHFWFKCSKILDFKEISEVMEYLMTNDLTDTSKYSKIQTKYALNTLNELFNVIHQKGTISYYLEESEELDKVLQIFIRINSGGTKLSYSDLLLSIATAQWKKKDAREVIHDFVDELNKIGERFSLNKDLILKSCLVLADFDVKFKVDNFTKENMKVIEKNWDGTSSAMRAAVELVSKLGYSKDNLLASNAIIPIAYFIYKNDFVDKIVHSSSREVDRKAIKEWLARVFLKGMFGGQPDSIYPRMRKLVNRNLGKFPLEETIKYYKTRRKSISFNEDDLDSLLDLKYGQSKAYCALTLLYPGLNHSFHYHQDHIHPKSLFGKNKLRKLGYSEDKIEAYQSQVNGLANLQLLQETQNIEKRDIQFVDWIKKQYPSENGRDSYLKQNHIKIDQSLDFNDFIEFTNIRKNELKAEFVKVLGIKKTTLPEEDS